MNDIETSNESSMEIDISQISECWNDKISSELHSPHNYTRFWVSDNIVEKKRGKWLESRVFRLAIETCFAPIFHALRHKLRTIIRKRIRSKTVNKFIIASFERVFEAIKTSEKKTFFLIQQQHRRSREIMMNHIFRESKSKSCCEVWQEAILRSPCIGNY